MFSLLRFAHLLPLRVWDRPHILSTSRAVLLKLLLLHNTQTVDSSLDLDRKNKEQEKHTKHKTKMAKVYLDAANVLEKFLTNQGGIKSLTFAGSFGNKKAVYALVCECIKCRFLRLALFSLSPRKFNPLASALSLPSYALIPSSSPNEQTTRSKKSFWRRSTSGDLLLRHPTSTSLTSSPMNSCLVKRKYRAEAL